MAKKQKGLLPKIENLIIGVFCLSFLIWVVPKCSTENVNLPALNLGDDSTEETSVQGGTYEDVTNAQLDSMVKAKITEEVSNNSYSRLYITIKNLKFRKRPSLAGTLIGELPLFEEVYFLNEVTDSTYKINLGNEVADEPWVKIMTKSGEKGWVYGAGVNYYKKKREGVLE